MKKLILFVLTVMLTIGLLINGCGEEETTTVPASTTTSKPPATTSTPIPTDQPIYGGVLKMISNSNISNIGYPQVDIRDSLCLRPAVESLVSLNPDGSGGVIPQLATSWKYNADFTTLTFTLREGVKFHDGTDFNAEAAKFCLDMVREDKKSTYLKSVSSVDVVDPYTVRLNLSSYEADLLLTLPDCAGAMVSPKAVAEMGEDCKLHPVGTGPFKFVSHQRDVNLVFEKFDDYWQEGKPYLDGIEWLFITDTTTGLAALKAGEAHGSKRVEPADAAALEASGDFVVKAMYGPAVGLAPDSANPDSIFKDIKIRQAMSYAIDSEAIAKALGHGYYVPISHLAAPVNVSYNPGVVGYPYNPTKAKELLAEAGHADDFTTKFLVESTATHKLMAEIVQSYFKDVGITLEIDVLDRATMNETRNTGWKDAVVDFMCGLEVYKDPGTNPIRYFSSKSSTYVSLEIPAEYDDMLFAAQVERDPAKRITMFQDVHALMIDKYCMIVPCYLSTSIYSYTKKLNDSDFGSYQTSWFPENAWLSK